MNFISECWWLWLVCLVVFVFLAIRIVLRGVGSVANLVASGNSPKAARETSSTITNNAGPLILCGVLAVASGTLLTLAVLGNILK